jgi:hypothetical protein
VAFVSGRSLVSWRGRSFTPRQTAVAELENTGDQSAQERHTSNDRGNEHDGIEDSVGGERGEEPHMNIVRNLDAELDGASGHLRGGVDPTVGSTNTVDGYWSSVSGGSTRSATDAYDWVAGTLLQND